MFHFTPISSTNFNYHPHRQFATSPSPSSTSSSLPLNPSSFSSFEDYDAYRSQIEQELLLQKQIQRRQLEEKEFYLNQHRQIQIQEQQQQQELLKAALLKKRQEEYIRQQVLLQQQEQEKLERRKLAERELVEGQYRNYLLALEHSQRQRQQQQYYQQQQSQQKQELEQEQLFNVLNHLAQLSSSTSPSSTIPIDSTPSIPVTIPIQLASPTSNISTSTITTEEDSAQATLQKHLESHLLRRKTLSKLSSLSSSLESKRSTFIFPSSLKFNPSPPSSNTSESIDDSTSNSNVSPKLAYSSINSIFLAYEDFLINLLSKVDEIESKGDGIIKSTRKELVREIEEELKKLDEGKDDVWRNQLRLEEEKEKEKEVAVVEDSSASSTQQSADITTPSASTTIEDEPRSSSTTTSTPSNVETSTPPPTSSSSTTESISPSPTTNLKVVDSELVDKMDVPEADAPKTLEDDREVDIVEIKEERTQVEEDKEGEFVVL